MSDPFNVGSKENLERLQKCIKEHPDSVDRMNNGYYCLTCLYTVIRGKYEPLTIQSRKI